MQPDQWKRIKTIVSDALDLPLEQRQAYVAQACGGDRELEGEVAALLAQPGETALLDVPVEAASGPDSGSVWIGRRLGAYRISEEILSGGMGRVFKGQRVDGEYDSLVAIKILRASIDTSEGRARFSAERQILARLRHPHIAALIDGGTVDGLPYFVMEYVDGLPIDRYCGEQRLDLVQRLRLFSTICGAVEFAHQQLIVHRDLKPENILVTGAGEPKLLDFGIAKLLDADEADGLTMLGGTGPYTPDYAAPEQLQGQPITTGSDVYSLGCILYRLLTGRLPFDMETARGAAWIRVVCEQPAERPSAALQRAANGADTALRAGLPSAPLLERQLSGELDLIVLKALEKEVALRYRTVAELHADVMHYLQGRPVSARRSSWSYLASKFIRRNRLPLGAAALAVLALAGGVAGIVWQARVAEQMRQRAESRLLDVQNLTEKLVYDYNDKIRVLPGALPVSQTLMADVSKFLDQLSREGDLPPQLHLNLALSYQRLAASQGSFRSGSLGHNDEAAASRGKAYAAMNALLERVTKHPGLVPATTADKNRISLWRIYMHVSDIERDMWSDSMRLSKFDQARAHMERAGKLVAMAVALAPADVEQATILSETAQFYAHHEGRYDDAIGLVRRAQALAAAFLKREPDDFKARFLYAILLTAEGLYLKDGKQDREGAMRCFLLGIEQDRQLHAAHPDNNSVTQVLAGDLFRAGNLALASKHLDDARKLLEEANATISPLVANGQDVYAVFVSGMIAKALADYHIQASDHAAAADTVARMRSIRRRLMEADPKSYDHIYYAASVHFTDARLLLLEKKGQPAGMDMEHGTAMLLPIARRDNGMYRRLIDLQFTYADMLLDGGYWADAVALLSRMEALAKELHKDKDADAYRPFAEKLSKALGRAPKGEGGARRLLAQ